MAKFAEGLGGSGVGSPDIYPVLDGVWPLLNSVPLCMAIIGDTLYVGGGFTDVGGTARNRLAAFDIPTRTLLAWNPNATSGSVNCMAVVNGQIWVGGTFTNVGGQARTRLAELDPITGAATAFDSAASSTVADIAVDATHVYISGSFATLGGQARNRVGQYLIADKTLTAWAYAGTLTAVDDLGVCDDAVVLYASAQDAILFIDKGTAALLNSFPTVDVGTLATSASEAFFQTPYLVKADGDGSNPEVVAAGGVFTPFHVQGNQLWVGFQGSLQGVQRQGIALYDIPSGQLLRESVILMSNIGSDFINTMAISGAGTVILGGSFQVVGSTLRKFLVSFPNFSTSSPVGA